MEVNVGEATERPRRLQYDVRAYDDTGHPRNVGRDAAMNEETLALPGKESQERD